MHRLKTMKIGTVQLWLPLLLSDKPMYGYEIIRELERRFSGYWTPKTGTIYPALEKLQESGLVTGQREFREQGPHRKHYAINEKGLQQLRAAMAQWAKMTEMIDTYKETHQALFKFKKAGTRIEIAEMLTNLGEAFKDKTFKFSEVFSVNAGVQAKPTEPMFFKLLYAKENHKYEIHIEIEWSP